MYDAAQAVVCGMPVWLENEGKASFVISKGQGNSGVFSVVFGNHAEGAG